MRILSLGKQLRLIHLYRWFVECIGILHIYIQKKEPLSSVKRSDFTIGERLHTNFNIFKARNFLNFFTYPNQFMLTICT